MDYIKIHINGSVLLLILLLLGFAGFIIWLYKTTLPPAGVIKQHILLICRIAAIVLVSVLLFEPVLALYTIHKELPAIAVLVDRSRSMALQDAGGSRRQTTLQFLKHPVWRVLEQQNSLHYFAFADTIEQVVLPWDSIAFDGWMTDINGSLERAYRQLNGKNLHAIILVSDGQYNYGSSQLAFSELSDVPVHTVGVGDSAEPRDIAVVQVLTNSVAYAGQKIVLDVAVSASGYQGKKFPLHLRSGNKTIESLMILAPEEGSIVNAQFEIIAGDEGVYKYDITAVPQPGEWINENNTRSVIIKVLKSRVKIMLISGEPGPEQSFLYQSLSASPDFLVRALIQKPDGRFITFSEDPSLTEQLEDYDLYILNQYPTSLSANEFFRSLTEHLIQSQKPWMFFYGPSVDFKKYVLLKNAGALEFREIQNIRDQLVYARLTPQGKNSALMMINASLEQTERYWSDLPPVWVDRMIAVPTSTSTVLLKADMNRATQIVRLAGEVPMIISRQEKKRKHLSVAFYGFWKMHFTPLGFGKTNPVYSRFLEQAVRWLMLTDEVRPVTITTHKTIYPAGEKTLITGQVYDDQYRPLSDAVFRATIRSGSQLWALQLNPQGHGRYTYAGGPFPVGDYTLTGEAEWNGVLLGRDEKNFSVEAFSPELVRTAQNRELLQTMARISGGRYWTPDQVSEFSQAFNGRVIETERKNETDLWNHPLLLIILSLLLATEWWIRKRSDML